MSTNVEPKVETATVTATGDWPEELVKKLADPLIVVDPKFTTLITATDNIEKQLGGKWVVVSEYLIKMKWAPLTEEEEKKPSKERQTDFKNGMNVVLKSLQQMGKTYSSAQSIRSTIFKLAKWSMAKAREDLKSGAITVREARQIGRTPQANPASGQRTNFMRYEEAVQNVVRYGMTEGFDTVRIYADIGRAYAQQEGKKVEKGATENLPTKAEVQEAIRETEKQVKAQKSS